MRSNTYTQSTKAKPQPAGLQAFLLSKRNERNFPHATSEQLDGKAAIASSDQANARERLREDVLTHFTKSAVKSVSDTLHLDLSDDTTSSTATWVVRAAKSVPLCACRSRNACSNNLRLGSCAFTVRPEMKWGDRADNMGKDAVLGGLKGIAMKGSMDMIGAKMHQSGLDKKFWAAPAQGVAFGVTGTATETGLSRSTYYDESGKYRGIGYGLAKTGEATANLENLAIGAATFTLGAGSMKLLQTSGAAKAFPELISNRIFPKQLHRVFIRCILRHVGRSALNRSKKASSTPGN